VCPQVNLAKRPLAYKMSESVVSNSAKVLGRELPAHVSAREVLSLDTDYDQLEKGVVGGSELRATSVTTPSRVRGSGSH